MHFGPYTLHEAAMGSDLVRRFEATRPEDDGTMALLWLDLPTPEARSDAAFLRHFEECMRTTLGLNHLRLLLPLEHGVDAGVPYLAYGRLRGVTLHDADRYLRETATPWPDLALRHVLHAIAAVIRHVFGTLGPNQVPLEPAWVWLVEDGDVFVDAFQWLGGWQEEAARSPVSSGDVSLALDRLAQHLHHDRGREIASESLASAVPPEAAASLVSIVRASSSVFLPDSADTAKLSADAPQDANDGVPLRRRFRRTQHAFAPMPPPRAETVVSFTAREEAKQSADSVPRGHTLEVDASAVVGLPPPPTYGVSSPYDAASSDLPLARVTVEAPAFFAPPAEITPPSETSGEVVTNSVLRGGVPTRGGAQPRGFGPRDLSPVWKITWILGCVTTGVLLGLLATAMLGFGPLAASDPDVDATASPQD